MLHKLLPVKTITVGNHKCETLCRFFSIFTMNKQSFNDYLKGLDKPEYIVQVGIYQGKPIYFVADPNPRIITRYTHSPENATRFSHIEMLKTFIKENDFDIDDCKIYRIIESSLEFRGKAY